MKNDKPDIYAIEFQSIYDIPFDDLVETTQIHELQENDSNQAETAFSDAVQSSGVVGSLAMRAAETALIPVVSGDMVTELSDVGLDLTVAASPQYLDLVANAPSESEIDHALVSRLVAQAIANMNAAEYKVFSVKRLLGQVRAQDIILSEEEVHEFLAAVASHPAVRSLESGKFMPRETDEHPAKTVPEPPFEQPVAPTSLSPKQIMRTIREVDRSADMRRAKDLMTRKANPRRRGRRKSGGQFPMASTNNPGKRAMGKAHGKKVTIEALIDQMNAAPRSTP